MSKRALLSIALLLGLMAFGLAGCSDDDEVIGGDDPIAPAPTEDVQLTCEGCHTSEEYLRATAVEEPEPEEPEGEG